MCTGAEVAAAYPELAAMFASEGAGTAAAGTAAGVGAGAAAAGAAGAYGAGTLTAAELAQIAAAEEAAAAAGGTAAGGEAAGGLLTGAPVTELSANATPVVDKSVEAGLLDKAGYYGNGLFSGGGGGGSSKALLAMQGLQMMAPQQNPTSRPAAPPMQGQQGPLPTMYGQQGYQARPMSQNVGPYGTAAGNSIGLTEEQKRKLREQGYQI